MESLNKKMDDSQKNIDSLKEDFQKSLMEQFNEK